MIRQLLSLLIPRRSYSSVPYTKVTGLAGSFLKIAMFGAMHVDGPQFSVGIFKMPQGKNFLLLSNVPDGEALVCALEKYQLEHRFSRKRCKIYFQQRIPERNSNNVISFQEFFSKILTNVYQRQATYGLRLKSVDTAAEKILIEKIEES